MENLKIYNAVREVPKEAQKPIRGGRINGMTDINPMWRLKTLTEQFGPAGIGWYYEIKNKWLEKAPNGEIAAFVEIDLFVKVDGEWSRPITGLGGSSFVANQSNGPYVSDECYKMALTDAISVSCKALGFGADIYWQGDRTKYDPKQQTAPTTPQSQPGEKKKSMFLDSYFQDQNKMIELFDWLDKKKAEQGEGFHAYNLLERCFNTTSEQRLRIIKSYDEHKSRNTAA